MARPAENRISIAIKSTGLTLKGFSDASKIPYPSLRDYISGKKKPGFDALASIARISKMSADWILTGSGDMRGGTKAQAGTVDPKIFGAIVFELRRRKDISKIVPFTSHMKNFFLGSWAANIYNRVIQHDMQDSAEIGKVVEDETAYFVSILEIQGAKSRARWEKAKTVAEFFKMEDEDREE